MRRGCSCPGLLLALLVVGVVLRLLEPRRAGEPPPPPRTGIAEFQARAKAGKPGPFVYDEKTDTYTVRTPRSRRWAMARRVSPPPPWWSTLHDLRGSGVPPFGEVKAPQNRL